MLSSTISIPEGLITRPTLIWEVKGMKSGEQAVEVSYLTKGMNWHAEYVGVFNADSQQLDLEAWVSVNTHCGTTFENAKLKLVAGEVHCAPPPQVRRRLADAMEKMATAAPAPAFEERELFEYHIYELERATSLKNNDFFWERQRFHSFAAMDYLNIYGLIRNAIWQGGDRNHC